MSKMVISYSEHEVPLCVKAHSIHEGTWFTGTMNSVKGLFVRAGGSVILMEDIPQRWDVGNRTPRDVTDFKEVDVKIDVRGA